MTSEQYRIYLASSWRNPHQADVLAALRGAGFDVYDFKNPAPGDHGFSWTQIPDAMVAPVSNPVMPSAWDAEKLRRVLAHPVAKRGYDFDHQAMIRAHACVLLLPSGMSAHLEAGWIGGQGKPVVVLAPEIREPELMYKLFDDWFRAVPFTPIFQTIEEVIARLGVVCDVKALDRCENCGKPIPPDDVFRWADDVTTCRSTCSPSYAGTPLPPPEDRRR